MERLGTGIVEAVVHHYGRGALLSRLSDPFWFQALGSVMGMDWHSSGITTSVMSALKRGLNPRAHELGVYVCGGRGKQSLRTQDELRTIAREDPAATLATVRRLEMPTRHEVRASDVQARRLGAVLALAHE